MSPIDWMDAQASLEEGGGGTVDASEALEGLNDPQEAAVTRGAGPLLILAGAGSGKTRVITRRIAWLVANGHARPQEILAITFTNKAAKEMRERVESFFPSKGLWISTFHSMCARILRRDIEHLRGWSRDFSIYDTHDKNQLIKSIVKELGYDSQRFRAGMVSGWISDWKSESHAQWEGRETVVADDEPGLGIEEEVFRKVRERYLRAMQENNALDFDDLLLKVLELFELHPGVRDAYASRFRFVLVDEYQDTNRVQYLLTRHLASWHKNLTVCGDPDQSIYAWRGADIRNILEFEQDFGEGREVEVIKLEQNYRSTRCILAAAQAVVQNNVSRREKDLWTERETEHKIQVLECGNEEDEANEIAAQIHSLRNQGVAPDEIAIFYRVNFMQRALERGLRLAGVPYQIVGGVEFYQRKEIRDLVSYLQLLVNPRDDVACARVLNVPARGIGLKSVEVLRSWAQERSVSLFHAATSEEARAQVRGRAKVGLAAFAGLFEELEGQADRPALDALEAVVEATDFFDWLAESGDNDVNREENVEELLTHARTYDKDNPEGGLRGFLQEVALVSDVDGYDESGPSVALMTLHSSKGLEFPVVFVAGLEEELLPHALAVTDSPDEEAGVEEERRLMYVGMTRAKDRLFLTHARTRFHYGETSYRTPSRFLDEIPPELAEGMEAEEDEADVLGEYEAPEEGEALHVGDRVEHDHFGYGHVTGLQGSGINARVTVEFQGVGSKVLLVQYAKLKVLGS